MTKFDLVRSRSAGRARGEASSPAAGARPAPFPTPSYSAAASRITANVDSMKNYLADRVEKARSASAGLPARVPVPLLGAKGCRRRSAARRRIAASSDGSAGGSLATKRSEDGSSASRTYVTEGTDSEAGSEAAEEEYLEEDEEYEEESCSSYDSDGSGDSDPFASEMEGKRPTFRGARPLSSVYSEESDRDGTNGESYEGRDESYEANGESYQVYEESYASTASRSYASDDEEGSYRSSDERSYHSSDEVRSRELSRPPGRSDAVVDGAGHSLASSRGGHSRASTAASAGRLARLLEENESLRRSVLNLRSDFEAMLRELDAAEGGDGAAPDDGSSVMSESSRISECLRRIDEVRSAARLKLRDRSSRARASSVPAGTEDEARRTVRERLRPYRDCIDDLLEENGRLYDQVAELTRERDEGMMRGCDTAADNVPRTTGEEPGNLLTDESTAEVHGEAVDAMAELLEDMSSCVTGGSAERERAGRLGSEIMGLVARIMGQRQQFASSTTTREEIPEVDEDSAAEAEVEADGKGAESPDGRSGQDGETLANPSEDEEEMRKRWSLCTVETGSTRPSRWA